MFLLTLFGYLSFFTVTKCDLVFGVQPKVINVGVTKNLVLNCSVTRNFVSDTSNITQLDLSRLNPATGEIDQILSMIQNSPNGAGLIEHTDNFKWTVKYGETYVSLTIPNPTEVDATEYMCEVHRSSQGNTQQVKVEVQLQDQDTTNNDTEEFYLSKNISESTSPGENVKSCLQINNSDVKCDTLDLDEKKCVQQLKSKGVVRISLDPDELTVGTTKDLHVMCIVSRQDSSDIFNWISIVISHSQRTDNPHFEDLLIIKKYDGQVQKVSFDQFRSDLKIQSDGTVYVRVSWRFPELNRVGLYRCELNGVDIWGRPQTLSSTSLLPTSRHDIDTIYESIRNLKSTFMNSINKMKSEIINIKASINQNNQSCFNNTEKSNTDISNLKEELKQNIEYVKQQEDLRIKLERYVKETDRLIASEVDNLKYITKNLTVELNTKSGTDIQTRCEEKFNNITALSEQTLEKVYGVTGNLTVVINELKLNQSSEYVNLRNSLQECKDEVNNASERFRNMVNEIKSEQMDQKSGQQSLRSVTTNLNELYNSLKTKVDTNTHNLSSLRLNSERHLANYTHVNLGNWEAFQKSLRDKLELHIKTTYQNVTKYVKDFEEINKRAIHPKSLFKNELNRLFFGSTCLRYWLTKDTYNHISVADAQSTCLRFGGYLAEIDSDTEYRIVKRFVDRHISRGTVLIGGTDSLNEGVWINRFSLNRISSTWAGKSYRSNQDCQCLSFNYLTLDMKDCSCDFSNHSHGRFMCEIPE